MNDVVALAAAVVGDVWTTVAHNWPYLLLSAVVASVVQVYLDADRLSSWLRRRAGIAVLGAVALGALTPFCSCGTTAVVLGALASSVPWAPVVAFLASSPLTSPQELVLSIGLFGPAFGFTYFVAAIVVGLVAGVAAWWLEAHGHLEGQARMSGPAGARPAEPGGCCGTAPAAPVPGGGGRMLTVLERPAAVAVPAGPRLAEFGLALATNARKLALYFLAFAGIGYLLIRLIPTEVMTTWLGQGNPVWSVPLAAVLGVPVYLNTEASLPLVAGLLQGGMSPGAAMAFLLTGAGTSIGSISGMLVIARGRVVALVIGSLFVTAIATGWLGSLWL